MIRQPRLLDSPAYYTSMNELPRRRSFFLCEEYSRLNPQIVATSQLPSCRLVLSVFWAEGSKLRPSSKATPGSRQLARQCPRRNFFGILCSQNKHCVSVTRQPQLVNLQGDRQPCLVNNGLDKTGFNFIVLSCHRMLCCFS